MAIRAHNLAVKAAMAASSEENRRAQQEVFDDKLTTLATGASLLMGGIGSTKNFFDNSAEQSNVNWARSNKTEEEFNQLYPQYDYSTGKRIEQDGGLLGNLYDGKGDGMFNKGGIKRFFNKDDDSQPATTTTPFIEPKQPSTTTTDDKDVVPGSNLSIGLNPTGSHGAVRGNVETSGYSNRENYVTGGAQYKNERQQRKGKKELGVILPNTGNDSESLELKKLMGLRPDQEVYDNPNSPEGTQISLLQSVSQMEGFTTGGMSKEAIARNNPTNIQWSDDAPTRYPGAKKSTSYKDQDGKERFQMSFDTIEQGEAAGKKRISEVWAASNGSIEDFVGRWTGEKSGEVFDNYVGQVRRDLKMGPSYEGPLVDGKGYIQQPTWWKESLDTANTGVSKVIGFESTAAYQQSLLEQGILLPELDKNGNYKLSDAIWTKLNGYASQTIDKFKESQIARRIRGAGFDSYVDPGNSSY